MHTKGMIIIFSDLFEKGVQAETVLTGLRRLRQSGHDMILFHVLDRDELEFPFERMTLFEGLEALPELLVDPKSLREAYLREITTYNETIRKNCLAQRIDYVRLVTDQPMDVALSGYLAARASLLKKHTFR
jgi:hypothetical protein